MITDDRSFTKPKTLLYKESLRKSSMPKDSANARYLNELREVVERIETKMKDRCHKQSAELLNGENESPSHKYSSQDEYGLGLIKKK